MLVLLLSISFFVVKPLFTTLLLAAILAYILYPLYTFFVKKIKNSTVSALIVCILVFLLLLIPGLFFIQTMVRESYAFFIYGKQQLALGLFQNCTNSFCVSMKEIVQEPSVYAQLQDILKAVTNWIFNKSSGLFLSLPLLMMDFFVFFFALFYFLKDGKTFVNLLGESLIEHKSTINMVMKRIGEIIDGLVMGNILIAILQGVVGALGFFIFGISSPIFWGLVMALFALLPYVGTSFVWLPAVLIMFLNGIFQDSTSMILKSMILFAYFMILVNVLEHILKPKLLGKKAKIHPLLILLGTVGGVFFFGPIGIIIGPIILSLTILFVSICSQE